MDKYDVIIVGAGLSGAVIANQFSDKKICVIEKRDHIAGNCYDYYDNDILINKYGAHIFHTNNEEVWSYINKFCRWNRYEHKVLAYCDKKLVPIPVNITTVNVLCNENIQNEKEMEEWLEKNQIHFSEISNSEEMGKSLVGEFLYSKLFKYYTFKQWGRDARELRKEVLSRIPLRKNFDCRYFTDKYQCLPEKGYTYFVQKLLDKPNIDVVLNLDFDSIRESIGDKVVVYTGPIDHYFKGMEKLEYRSINFVKEIHDNYYQPCAVVNYSDEEDFTRIVEYKHFTNAKNNKTIIVKEYTCDNGEPYYPILNERNLKLYEKYQKLCVEKNVHFVGRLANYKYFNMDEAILNALNYFRLYLSDI